MPEVIKTADQLPAGQWSLWTDTDVTGAFTLQGDGTHDFYVRRATAAPPDGMAGRLIVRDGEPMVAASLDELFPGVDGARLWIRPIDRPVTVTGSYA